jgi:hypothetical protein
MAKVQSRTGVVHTAKNVRFAGRVVQAPACSGTRNLHYASPVEDDKPLTCARCLDAEAKRAGARRQYANLPIKAVESQCDALAALLREAQEFVGPDLSARIDEALAGTTARTASELGLQ